MNEMDLAVEQQKLATSLTPENPARCSAPAELYPAQGKTADFSQAPLRAKSIQHAAKSSTKSVDPRDSR
jgi:hypothetical protein